jgi:hypothetical protein
VLVSFAEDTMLLPRPTDQNNFSKPGRKREVGRQRRLDVHRSIGDTKHTWTSLKRTVVFVLFKEPDFSAGWLPITPRCASRGSHLFPHVRIFLAQLVVFLQELEMSLLQVLKRFELFCLFHSFG